MAESFSSTGPQSMAATLSPEMSHDDKVAHFTGGLSSRLPELPPFAGSERLRPDGRPQPEFRAELRRISNATNAFHVVFTLSLPFLFAGLPYSPATGHPLLRLRPMPSFSLRWGRGSSGP